MPCQVSGKEGKAVQQRRAAHFHLSNRLKNPTAESFSAAAIFLVALVPNFSAYSKDCGRREFFIL